MSDAPAPTIHRAGSGKQVHKPYKSKHSTKNSLKRTNKGRIIKGASLKHNMIAGQEQMSRTQRRNRSEQIRKQKKDNVLFQKRIGQESAPKIVAMISLSEQESMSVSMSEIRSQLDQQFSSSSSSPTTTTTTSISPNIPLTIKLDKKRVTLFEVAREARAVLDAGKVADILLFVIDGENGVDSLGEFFISLLRAQGFCSSLVLMTGLEKLGKKKNDVKKYWTRWIQEQVPDDPRVIPFESKNQSDLKQLGRWLGEQSVKEIQWREKRPYLVVEKYEFVPSTSAETSTVDASSNNDPLSSLAHVHKNGTLIVRGFLRGKGITPNQLVHIVNYGTYQLSKIELLDDPCPLKKRVVNNDDDEMNNGSSSKYLLADPAKQESLQTSLPPDTTMNEQTWPTEEDFQQQIAAKKIKKVPKGFSEYQAAWIVDSDNEAEDGDEEEEDEDEMGEYDEEDDNLEDGDDYQFNDVASEAQTHVDRHFNIDDDEAMTEEERIAERERIMKKIQESREDMEFPDEVVTPIDVAARVRFQKYRGLKSFRQSPWDPKENLPVDYSRIFQFENFQRSQKLSMLDPSEYSEEACADRESYVAFHINDVPENLVQIHESNPVSPLLVFGLMRHEQKYSVMHFQIKKCPDYDEPIKSKDELIVQIGFRTFKCNPVYSEHNPRNDKHKFERFLQPHRFLAASVFAPITFKPSPVLMFKRDPNALNKNDRLRLVATGALLGVDPDRVMIKKLILTGHPFKIHKKQSVVRYMFHNAEDIRWFRPVEIYTKNGRHGIIKESLGTHGYMKCLFDDVVHQSDTVCMNLYKRVYPKWTTEHFSLLFNQSQPSGTTIEDVTMEDEE